jgi:hypothetical protein
VPRQKGRQERRLTRWIETDESDGESALQALEAQEQSQGARRGLANGSLQHFHDPVPVLSKDRSLR